MARSKGKVVCQVYETIEDMQAKITEILHAYSATMMAKITGFSFIIEAANAI